MSILLRILTLLYCINFICADVLLHWKSQPQQSSFILSASQFDYADHVSAGATHLVFSKDRNIYILGYYGPKFNSSQLSMVHQNTTWTKKLSTRPPITDLCSGSHHSLMLLQTGSLCSWGYNVYGQVGIGENFPQLVERATKVVQGEMMNDSTIDKILCGSYNSAIITNDNKMFVWGYGAYGAIGNGQTRHQSSPTAVKFPTADQIVASAAGHHFFVVATKNKLIFWGDNSKGASGYSDKPPLILEPMEMPAPALQKETIIQMVSGQSHTLILVSTGQLFGFGSNKSYQLGLAGTQSTHSLTKLPHRGFREIAVTFNSSFGLLEDGRILFWGSHSWLFPNTGKKVLVPTPIDLNGYVASAFAVKSVKGSQLFVLANKKS